MGEAGFEGIRKPVTRRQNTVAEYIAMRPNLDLCERSTRAAGSEVVSAVVGTGGHRLGGGKEKGGKGKNGFGIGVGVGFRRRGVEWSEWVKWSGVEWSGSVNDPRMTTGRN